MSEWKPVENGRIRLYAENEIEIEGEWLSAYGADGVAGMQLPDDIRLCRRVEPAPITASYGPHLPPERAIRIALDWAEDQDIITEDDRQAALDWLHGQREGQGEL